MADQQLDERGLQTAYQAWMRHDRGAHLDEAAWQRLGAGDAAQSERDLLFAHIVTCSDCSQIWRIVSAVGHDAEAERLIERHVLRPSWFRSLMVPATAAATLLLVAGGVMMLREPAASTDATRSAASPSTVEGLMMAYAPDGTPTLVWTPVTRATSYRIEIFSADGQPLWSGDIATPPMPWPPDLPRAKATYRWRVDAHSADGVIARSRLAVLELTR